MIAIESSSSFVPIPLLRDVIDVHRSVSNLCRRCDREVETLAHVLGACPHGYFLRNTRHHIVRSIIATALRNKGYSVYEEVHGISSEGSNRRIDIIEFKPPSLEGYLRRFINSLGYLASELDEDDNAGEMSPESSTESYPAFAHIGLRENPGETSTRNTKADVVYDRLTINITLDNFAKKLIVKILTSRIKATTVKIFTDVVKRIVKFYGSSFSRERCTTSRRSVLFSFLDEIELVSDVNTHIEGQSAILSVKIR
ncbi:hypothetical protein ANN_17072 [Periplaneta americana]|uniref:Reverse transcriptase n=1 Tax=Periplaneta americana TaxID=6978 RepID=A0ABQ8ST89_PERAM|nr:hypothetical protein ANN_17072 [Periplaneta americana]